MQESQYGVSANTTFHVSGFGGQDTICSTEWHVKPKWINVSTLYKYVSMH